MAKNDIPSYDATAANNTDVQSVDISENCSPAGINNAIREVMADLKNVDTGAVSLTSPSASQLNVDNLRLDGNTISSTDTNGNITLDPNGTGDIVLDANVGIGSSAPSRKLELNNGGTGALVTFTDGVATNFTFKTDGSSVGTFGTEAGSTQLAFMVANSEKMRLDGTGILLHGKTATNSDNAGFEVGTNGAIAATRASGHAALLNRLTDDGRILNLRKDGTTVGGLGVNGSLLHIALREDGSNPVALAGSGSDTGSVVPATTSGAERDNAINLGKSTNRFKHGYFANTVYTASLAGITDNDTYINFANNNIMQFITGGSERARFSAGDVLIGCTSLPSASVAGAGFFAANNAELKCSSGSETGSSTQIRFLNGNGEVGAIRTSGSTTSFVTSSDYRLKEAVTPITNATDRLKQLNPVRFNFIADPDTTVDGFLAHEVSDIVPEAISGEKDAMKDEQYEVTPAVLDDDGNEVTPAEMGTRSVPDYQGIDQSKLVPLLVATIQELEARIAALEA